MAIWSSHTSISDYLAPPTALSPHHPCGSHTEEADRRGGLDKTLFTQQGALRIVALTVEANTVNEWPAISLPARDARQVLMVMEMDRNNILVVNSPTHLPAKRPHRAMA